MELSSAANAFKDTSLFEIIGGRLSKRLTVFLIGGENLRAYGLREDGRHDYDFVVSNDVDFNILVSSLADLGFQPVGGSLPKNLASLHAREMMHHEEYGLVDIFSVVIGKHHCYLSERMTQRAEFAKYGRLNLGLLHINDIFLLKSVADREKDMQDILKIVKISGFDWLIVWDELKQQEHDTREYIAGYFLDTIDDIIAAGFSAPPFLNSLIRRVLDNEIQRFIRESEKPLDELLAVLLRHSSITKDKVMKRIEYLRKYKRLRVTVGRNGTILKLRDRGSLNVYRKYGASNSYESALSFVDIMATRAKLSENVKQNAVEIMHQLNRHGMFGGRKPQATVAAVLAVAAEEAGQHYSFTNTDIRLAANVSGNSFHKNFKRIWLFVKVTKMMS